MKKVNQLLSAAMTLALGILFLIFKDGILGILMTVLGVVLVVTAILDLIRIKIVSGVIKGVLGVLILVFGIGKFLLDFALLVIGIVLLIYGILELIKRIFAKKKGQKIWVIILSFLEPILCIVGSVFLLFNTGETVAWTIIVAGVLLIVEGILGAVAALAAKK